MTDIAAFLAELHKACYIVNPTKLIDLCAAHLGNKIELTADIIQTYVDHLPVTDSYPVTVTYEGKYIVLDCMYGNIIGSIIKYCQEVLLMYML